MFPATIILKVGSLEKKEILPTKHTKYTKVKTKFFVLFVSFVCFVGK
jgi:hypothetical protein